MVPGFFHTIVTIFRKCVCVPIYLKKKSWLKCLTFSHNDNYRYVHGPITAMLYTNICILYKIHNNNNIGLSLILIRYRYSQNFQYVLIFEF